MANYMFKNSIILLIFSLFCLESIYSQANQQKPVTICIIADNNNTHKDKEYQSLVAFLNKKFPARVTEITAMDITGMDIFPAQSVLWIYKNDTLPVENSYSKTTLSILKAYAKDGGCILLANQAMMLLKDLGLEKTVPQTRVKPSKDEGYGRQLGYHAFLSHPLFDGMNGGAYVLKPLKDTAVMQTGYFGEIPGLKGKVVAVDWDYIFLREDSKMIMEYEYGKGKVLAIGGYMVFSAPNRNRIHLEKFASNAIAYLSDGSLSPGGHYWHAGTNKAIEKEFDIPEESI